MSYKISAKNRKVKKLFSFFYKIITMGGMYFSIYQKIIIFGSLIGILGLFINWFETENNIGNRFDPLLGLNGYILFILYIKILAILLSPNFTQKIKTIFGFNLKDEIIILFLGGFGFFMTLNTIFVIKGINFFKPTVFDKGVALSITSFILIITGAILIKKLSYINKDIGVYIPTNTDDTIMNEIINKDKNNMKLPF